MKRGKRLRDSAAALWDRVRPLAPRHRSKEAWLAYCKKNGVSPDGVTKP
jgi:hypothetical protein